MKHYTALGAAALSLLSAAVLVACGGGDAPMASAPQTEVSGVVLGGQMEGGKVFLDLNNNQAFDAGEPVAAVRAEDGSFVLHVGERSAAELSAAMLVHEVAPTAKDKDDGGRSLSDSGRSGYTLMAPAWAYLQPGAPATAVLSPLTTLVGAEVAFNGMTVPEAKAAIQQSLGLQQDPLANYGDGTAANVGRAAGVALAMAPSNAPAAGQRIAEATQQAKAQLPSVISLLGLDQGGSAVGVQAVQNALAAAQPAARGGSSQDSGATEGRRFIVKLRDSVADPQERGRRMAGSHRGELRHTFTRAMKGFAVTVPADQAEAFLSAAASNPEIEFAEADQVMTLVQTVQSSATWGLDRSDQRDLPLNRSYSYMATGAGVRAYILDTGIRASHIEFQGRIASGYSAISDGRGTTDCNGHGTHVAGTVGGTTWGIAKGVTLVPLRVLDCEGSGLVSGIVAAIDWMIANAQLPAVANLSLGGPASIALDAAVARAVAAGIPVTVAAGNRNSNACNFSPSREPVAITVGATTNNDARAVYSNFGTCLDVFAPGSSITSAGIGSNTASAVLSGTSMAAPHVAGVAALYLEANPAATPAAVASVITTAASSGKVTGAGSGSTTALLYADLSSGSTAPEPPISSPEPPISSPEPPISSPEPPISSPEPPPPPPPSVSVGALSGSAKQLVRREWRAQATIAVRNNSGALVPGVVVHGAFTVGGSGLSCTTASNGTCSISSGLLSSRTTSTRFSVSSLVVSGFDYNAGGNVMSSVTIARP